jgi:hypothetical protein
MRAARFEAGLAAALQAAARSEAEASFHLGGYAARRALGQALVVDIDPARLTQRLRHRVPENGRLRVIRDRFVGGGDWGPLLDPVGEASTYRDTREIVAAGFEYQRTEAYRRALARAEAGAPLSRNFVALDTPTLVEHYFRRTAELARSIQQRGVVRRTQYRRIAHVFGDPRLRPPWVEVVESDIGVAIAASGELLRFGPGKHRTAIAQALGLPSVPVEVRMVHADWLRRRMTANGLGPVDALLDGIAELARAGT